MKDEKVWKEDRTVANEVQSEREREQGREVEKEIKERMEERQGGKERGMTKKYRKKPVEVEAIQWVGDNLRQVIDFTGKYYRFDEWFSSMEEYEAHVKADRNIFKVFTLEGVMEASVGDYIIKGVKGEFYPCKPDIFEATYEPVSTQGGE